MSMKKTKKGLTLIEIVISLSILGFIIGILFYFINWKIRESVTERGLSFMEADIAIARQLIEWDIWMAGYGLESSIYPIQISSGAINGSDTLKIRSIAFITQAGKWSFTIEDASNTDKLIVNKWSDPDANFIVGDTVVIMRSDKELVAGPVYIVSAKDTSYTTTGGVVKAGLLIQLSQLLEKLPYGSLLFEANGAGGTYREVVYSLGNDGVLRRSGDDVIKNLAAFWVDVGMDTTSELTGEVTWFDSLDSSWSPDFIRQRLKAVQIAMVIHSSGKDRNYRFPDSPIVISTPDGGVSHSYVVSGDDIHYHWNTVIILAKPRNLLR